MVGITVRTEETRAIRNLKSDRVEPKMEMEGKVGSGEATKERSGEAACASVVW